MKYELRKQSRQLFLHYQNAVSFDMQPYLKAYILKFVVKVNSIFILQEEYPKVIHSLLSSVINDRWDYKGYCDTIFGSLRRKTNGDLGLRLVAECAIKRLDSIRKFYDGITDGYQLSRWDNLDPLNENQLDEIKLAMRILIKEHITEVMTNLKHELEKDFLGNRVKKSTEPTTTSHKARPSSLEMNV